MKPYDDENCKCHKIFDEISAKYPEANWNMDKACEEWAERVDELKDNNIEFGPGEDENYGCVCPTCGNMVCGLCV